MTAEIAVLNQEAVALAADSAVSGQAKIFTSANKIFALSKYHPVAVMVNDSAQFLGVPWETIVKTYREQLGARCFATLRAQAAHFLGFFDQRNPLFPPEQQMQCNQLLWERTFEGLIEIIDSRLEERAGAGEQLTEMDIGEQALAVIQEAHAAWTAPDLHPSLPADHGSRVIAAYDPGPVIESVFERIPLSEEARVKLREIAEAVVSRDAANEQSPFHSGVVIAGYGDREYFPRLFEFDLETIALDRLKYVHSSAGDIEISASNSAAVRAFAQRDQVAAFMEGIDENMREATIGFWAESLKELASSVDPALLPDEAARVAVGSALTQRSRELLDAFAAGLHGMQQEFYIQPIIRVVALMPKDELAAMAESLVNLTSFKRKVTEEAETVGGPIDVAVISKGDGLIWIKRKHYFEASLNQQFFANYYRDRPR